MNIALIGTLPVGTEIVYGSVNATIVGFARNGNALIGIKQGDVFAYGWEWNESIFYELVRASIDLRSFFRFYWVGYTEKCYVPEPKVILPNQVCAGCELPAPHVSPNVGDKFVCLACKLLKDLDQLAAGG